MNRLIALSLLFLFAVGAHAQRAVATLDRSTVAVGEGVGFSIACENFQPSNTPRLPFIPGLRIAGAAPNSFQLGGGQQTSTLTYNFLITPNKIPAPTPCPRCRSRRGRSLQDAGTQAPRGRGGLKRKEGGISEYAFMRLVVGKNTAYVGEPIPVEIQLFLQNGRYSPPELTAEGSTCPTTPSPSLPGRSGAIPFFRCAPSRLPQRR